ncbi:DHA1 family bicyclomycin/chloramphenicol resistance-like MFS transporter [Rubricella aquisinus]|uniref:Bcr/CflA family efflux transporter n=1 Tax=Rubricella aquisinus TaxID=2028108 RepID=A0A840WP13_9RHOB|nr:multidrug effflux MFS transporter [Rubricella aquisinus]MBB5515823.1 DHA1 family bicyclomycin/chloramphenicol resistance-like MFS transporter [Rubricella aquisinus]
MSFTAFVAVIASLMGLNALAIDIMLPGLPQLGAWFMLDDPNRAQVVITAYLIGFGVGQFFMGLLADRFGRRPVLLSGVAVYMICTVICIVAPSFELLLAARLAQGLASAAPRVVATATVRDCYDGRQMARVMSLTLMVFMAVPVVAPLLGQVILFVAPWQAVFAFLTIYSGTVLVICARRMPETLDPAMRRPIERTVILSALRSILRSRQTVGYTLAAGVFFGALFGFINSAQQVLGDVFGLGTFFPVVFAAVALAIAASSYANSRLVERLGMRLLSHGAVILFLILSTLMLLLEWHQALSLMIFLPLFVVMMLLVGMVFSNFNAMAMEPQGHVAGLASSFVGAMGVLIGAGIGFVIGQAFDGSVMPLAIGYVGSGLGTLILILLTERGRLFHTPAADPM